MDSRTYSTKLVIQTVNRSSYYYSVSLTHFPKMVATGFFSACLPTLDIFASLTHEASGGTNDFCSEIRRKLRTRERARERRNKRLARTAVVMAASKKKTPRSPTKLPATNSNADRLCRFSERWRGELFSGQAECQPRYLSRRPRTCCWCTACA